MEDFLKTTLSLGVKRFGISLDEEKIKKFEIYLRELNEWNKKVNITSIKDDYDIIIKHFIDSLFPIKYIKSGSKVLDLGSGGGFPGIPLKIYEPALRLYIVDSSRKRVYFLKYIIRLLSLSGVTVIQKRGEELSVLNDRYELIISRSFSKLDRFLRISNRVLDDKGEIIAMKGPNYHRELSKIIPLLKKLNLNLDKKIFYDLPFISAKRVLLFFTRCFT
jgi:16S rRNA (guanine527-N7)-methyltransferase